MRKFQVTIEAKNLFSTLTSNKISVLLKKKKIGDFIVEKSLQTENSNNEICEILAKNEEIAVDYSLKTIKGFSIFVKYSVEDITLLKTEANVKGFNVFNKENDKTIAEYFVNLAEKKLAKVTEASKDVQEKEENGEQSTEVEKSGISGANYEQFQETALFRNLTEHFDANQDNLKEMLEIFISKNYK